jgi:hypothetical protein
VSRRIGALLLVATLIGVTAVNRLEAEALPASVSATATDDWRPLGGLATSDAAVLAPDPNSAALTAYAADEFGSLRTWSMNSGGDWQRGNAYGGELASPPSAISSPGQGSLIVVLGTDNAAWYVTGNSTPGFQSLGGFLLSTPEAAWTSQDAYVFGVGGDNALWFRSFFGGGWVSLGGYLTSDLTAVVDPSGLYVFGVGGDNALWFQRRIGASWSGWQSLGGSITGFPTAASDASGLYVMCRGEDGALWFRRLAGTWSGWQSLGGFLGSAPEVVSDPSGVFAFVVGGDDAMWYRRLSGTWFAWQTLGGVIISNPTAISGNNNSGVQVLGVGQDFQLYAHLVSS